MLSYVVLALNLAVYAVGIGIALTAGGEASNDYFLQLAKVNEDVLNGQYWRCEDKSWSMTFICIPTKSSINCCRGAALSVGLRPF